MKITAMGKTDKRTKKEILYLVFNGFAHLKCTWNGECLKEKWLLFRGKYALCTVCKFFKMVESFYYIVIKFLECHLPLIQLLAVILPWNATSNVTLIKFSTKHINAFWMNDTMTHELQCKKIMCYYNSKLSREFNMLYAKMDAPKQTIKICFDIMPFFLTVARVQRSPIINAHFHFKT